MLTIFGCVAEDLLIADWELAVNGQQLCKIEPLR